MTVALWRVWVGQRSWLARGDTEHGPVELLDPALTVSALLTDNAFPLQRLATLPTAGRLPDDAAVLAPVDRQPVWAAGVTFPRSRQARREEAIDGGDAYDRVFDAARAELFFKAAAEAVVRPGEPVGIRADSTWDVPEPELGIVADHRGRPQAFVLGNDMSSRSVEGENPLYLHQAKIYDRSCALGPCLVPVSAAPDLARVRIGLSISRDGVRLYDDTMNLSAMRRDPQQLLAWLFLASSFPQGVVVLTGTSLVPPSDITLRPDDQITIRAAGFGVLHNPVSRVGSPAPGA
ncbi:fumarylacetoacetate hydrolase family protein [Streptomyces sp. CA-106131]|uniref:fumarylacetoacetate hydrolase family protein n=1 Tax=Streptomyces sp. CA-106131 TaxID=3240045 RepID=UPI003D919167